MRAVPTSSKLRRCTSRLAYTNPASDGCCASRLVARSTLPPSMSLASLDACRSPIAGACGGWLEATCTRSSRPPAPPLPPPPAGPDTAAAAPEPLLSPPSPLPRVAIVAARAAVASDSCSALSASSGKCSALLCAAIRRHPSAAIRSDAAAAAESSPSPPSPLPDPPPPPRLSRRVATMAARPAGAVNVVAVAGGR